MSEEQFKAFFERVKVDPSIRQQVKEHSDPDSVNSVVEIAQSAGFQISAEDFVKTKLELKEDDLETAWLMYYF